MKKTLDETKKGLEICKQGGNWHDTCGKGCPYAGDDECAKALPADALAHIQHLEAKVPRWISVEERLPEEFSTVLIMRDDSKRARVGWLIDGHWSVPKGVRVTHWMPLPEPPVEE